MASLDVFAALANPVRRKILELLLRKPWTVKALADEFAQQRPAISEHLQVLREARLVRYERRGRERLYYAEPSELAAVQKWLAPFERYWRGRMKALSEVLDEDEKEKQ